MDFVSPHDAIGVVMQRIWDLLVATAKAGCKSCCYQLFSSFAAKAFVSSSVQTQTSLLFFLKYHYSQHIYSIPRFFSPFPVLSSKTNNNQAHPEEMTEICLNILISLRK